MMELFSVYEYDGPYQKPHWSETGIATVYENERLVTFSKLDDTIKVGSVFFFDDFTYRIIGRGFFANWYGSVTKRMLGVVKIA